MITLYIKTHNKTGLKYFGKTANNPMTYKGSGKYWLNHIKKHGNNVTTEIYAHFETECEELVETALKFSNENNITKSKNWANLQDENGLDGNSKHFYNENSYKALKYWEYKSKEELATINSKKSCKGNKNGMFGVHRNGEKAPNFGKNQSTKSKTQISKSLKEYYKNNPRSKKPKAPKVSKRNYNKLIKLYKGRRKPPEYPKSGKLTIGLQVLFEEYDIKPYN